MIDFSLGKDKPLIIDGGLSNVLEHAGYDLNHPLWTALLLDKHPEAIIQAHLAYLKAGAQCITTSSYQASIPGLLKQGYHLETAKNLILKSVELTEIAIERAEKAGYIKNRPFIAASIGPYGAYLADGSEYRGNYGVDDQILINFHEEKIKLLSDSNADMLAFETIPSFKEAKVIAHLLRTIEKPSWISFSCKDSKHINDGTPIEEAVHIFEEHTNVFAIGVNCTHPKFISELIPRIRKNCSPKDVIVYPNSGEVYDPESKAWKEFSQPVNFVKLVNEWLSLGAGIIGGCCRIGPEQIQSISYK